MGKKNKEPDVRQPSRIEQMTYQSLRDNDATIVKVRKKKYKIRWLKNGQLAKMGRLLLHKKTFDVARGEKEDNKQEDILSSFLADQKLACKTAAIMVLDGFWKVRMKYWFLWRWFYYIRQYQPSELDDLISEGKKKVPLEQFLKVTMYLTGARDTLMMMRTAEAERILHELSSVQPTASQKESGGSPTANGSSSGS